MDRKRNCECSTPSFDSILTPWCQPIGSAGCHRKRRVVLNYESEGKKGRLEIEAGAWPQYLDLSWQLSSQMYAMGVELCRITHRRRSWANHRGPVISDHVSVSLEKRVAVLFFWCWRTEVACNYASGGPLPARRNRGRSNSKLPAAT